MASRCPSCTDTGTKACASCKGIKYCSEECQQADWPFHKSFCAAFKRLGPRPSDRDDYRLVVFFPETGTEPEFKWVAGSFYESRKELCGKDIPFYAVQVQVNEITGVKMGRDVALYFDDCFQMRYDRYNDAISTVAANRLAFRWRGPLIAICGPSDCGPERMVDMDMLACSDLAAFLVDYYNERPAHLQRKLLKGKKVDAVKATRPGEQALNGSAPYMAVKVPVMHPIFLDDTADVAAVSEAIGDQDAAFDVEISQEQALARVDQRESNIRVAFMHKGIDPRVQSAFTETKASFGFPPGKWDTRIGNALVMRQDRKSLKPEEVDAFGDFCFHHLTQYFQLRSERLGFVSEARMQEVYALVVLAASPKTWKTYLQDWRQVKAGVLDDVEIEGRVDGKVRMGLNEEDGKKLCYHLLCTHREEAT